MDAPELESLAAIAHVCWCASMTAQGWSPGPYNPQARTHDALVAYAELEERDKRSARVGVESLDLDRTLAESIRYSRGPARELELSEMRKGLAVALASAPQGKEAKKDLGRVESWETDPRTGLLELIRVRWGDGSLSEHLPCEEELRRV